jgi:hypothetical protein
MNSYEENEMRKVIKRKVLRCAAGKATLFNTCKTLRFMDGASLYSWIFGSTRLRNLRTVLQEVTILPSNQI